MGGKNMKKCIYTHIHTCTHVHVCVCKRMYTQNVYMCVHAHIYMYFLFHILFHDGLSQDRASQVALVVKNTPFNAGVGSIPGSGRFPGKGMATHSHILAWRIPRTEEPSGLQSMGSQKVWHNWATKYAYMHICITQSLCCIAEINTTL